MNRALVPAWRWSWLVTLPATVIFGAWLSATAGTYSDFGLRRFGGDSGTLHKIGAREAETMLRRLELAVRGGRPAPAWPPTLHLSIPEASVARLDARLPHSGFVATDAELVAGDGKVRRVHVRYRGDNSYHWAYPKKSLRIKLRNGDSIDGLQAFNLIAPHTTETLNNWLCGRLGALLGVATPLVEPRNLELNGRPAGLYLLTEQPDETTLRHSGLGPCELLVGEVVARDAYSGIDNQLFDHPGLWERAGADDRPSRAARAQLDRLADLLALPPSEAQQQELAKVLDMEAFGRFAALEILCCTVHVDSVHNWRLGHDDASGCLVPLAWDLMGWHESSLPRSGEGARLDVLSSPLHSVLLGNGDFLRARHEAIRAFFVRGDDAKLLAELARTVASLAPSVEADPHVVVLGQVVRPPAVRAAMEALGRSVAAVLADVEKAYLGPGTPPAWTPLEGQGSLGLAVRSRAPVEALVFRFPQGPTAATPWAEVAFVSGGTRHVHRCPLSLEAKGKELVLHAGLVADFVPRLKSLIPLEVFDNRAEVVPGCYEITLHGAPPLDAGVEVEVLIPGGRRVRAALDTTWRPSAFVGVQNPLRPPAGG